MTKETSIEFAVQSWGNAWSNRNKKEVLALWDGEDPDTFYLPAECEHPLVSMVAIEKYVAAICTQFRTIRHRPEAVITKQLSDDIGLAFYVLKWVLADSGGPFGGQYRVTALWRRRQDQWKLTAYAEAPLAPLVELKEYYQHVAAEGLPK